ncbi:M48 family metallopeptidase [Haloarchaeobius sp. FL176]|uniref:M48 family metallopeptidase n=1 Tax=Haloarchaeobius sp. FL176 TaxID=2967129 RepID=UPI002147ABC7|nr:M48 family metalloprotease [Haloarchaeobius sp. FL176]
MDSDALTTRLLTVATGLVLLVLYLLLGALFAGVFAVLWTGSPDPVWLAVALLLSALVFGYASYRGGTARILGALEATELPRDRAPELHARVERLADAMDVGEPTLLVGRMPMPNALAIGGRADGSAIVLDAGLFRLLTLDELETIVAHELAHVESRDSLVQTLGYSVIETFSGLLFLLLLPVGLLVVGLRRAVRLVLGRPLESLSEHVERAYVVVAGVVVASTVVATLLLRAHSRRRELVADDRAAEVTGRPEDLARALTRIDRASNPDSGLLSSLYIHGEEDGGVTRLLATHPPMRERVERLLERADEAWTPIEVE